MGKSIIKAVFLFLSIFLLFLSPLASAFSPGAKHVHSLHPGHKHQICHADVHISSWNLISHRQLTAPPNDLRIKDLFIILYSAGFLSFILSARLFFAKKWLSRAIYTTFFPVDICLQTASLLI